MKNIREDSLGDAAIILSRLRSSIRPKISTAKFAEEAGIPTTTYANYENRYYRKYLNPDVFEKVAPVLLAHGVSREEVSQLIPPISEPQQRGLTEYQPSNRLPPPLASVPEFGTAAATDGFIEGLGSQYPVDVIDVRLPDGCFAVRVVGESMSPRYRPNEIVFIQPNRMPDAGQDCLVETNEGHGYIKTYLKKASKTYILGQYSTKEPFEIPIARVKQLHAVKCRWG